VALPITHIAFPGALPPRGRLGIPYLEGRSTGIPTACAYDLTKARRLLGGAPQLDIIRMIDDALAFERGEEIGVLPPSAV
jgi:hypothetical protein